MLSTTAEYALRIMVTLTANNESAMTSEQIARSTQVPVDYSVKVLQALARGGLVKAQRGRGGGFRITCDPAETSLLTVISAIDESLSGNEMKPLDTPTPVLATLRGHVTGTLATARNAFGQTTLRSVVDTSEATNAHMHSNGSAAMAG
ncbi:MAG: Rrf2 family transcriptional regulator [Planctomycetota bacterium]